jgi:hypothetical protein
MHKLCLRFLALCSLLLALRAVATDLTDLGQGLSYLRIHSAADADAALRKAAPGTGALVLDLRYATADEASATALKAALAGRPATVFILVSPATAPALIPVIAAAPALALGVPGSVPAPRIVVQGDAAADRRAFDAVDAGTELSKLITGKIEKERFDEASLVQEFKNGNDPAPPPTPDPTAPKTGEPKEAPAPLPGNPAERGVSGTNTGPATAGNSALVDRVLQRAVHLHRALLALRR